MADDTKYSAKLVERMGQEARDAADNLLFQQYFMGQHTNDFMAQFDGADPRVFNRALSHEEIRQDYQNQPHHEDHAVALHYIISVLADLFPEMSIYRHKATRDNPYVVVMEALSFLKDRDNARQTRIKGLLDEKLEANRQVLILQKELRELKAASNFAKMTEDEMFEHPDRD